MGSTEIDLAFLPDLARSRTAKCDSYQLSMQTNDSCGNVFVSFELASVC